MITTHSTGYNSVPKSAAIGDFDHDNHSDIAIVNYATNNILILTSYAIHPRTHRLTYSTGVNSLPNSIVVDDFNSDNQSDVAVVNVRGRSFNVFLGLGNGTFENQKLYFIENNSIPESIAVGDFNKDNNLDIVVGIYSISAISIYLGNSNGTFKQANIYQMEGSYPITVAVGDFNNDSNLDIVTAIYGSNHAGVFLGLGNGTFTMIKTYAPESDLEMNSVAVGDFNNDNLLDFVLARYQRCIISIHLGYGNGSFRISMIISTGNDYPSSIAIGDVNSDTRLDLIVANPYSSSIDIFLGYGNGIFGKRSIYLTGPGSLPWSIALGYLNNDTFLDIAITNGWYNNIGIIMGYGNGTFGVQNMFSTGFNSLPNSIAFGDFNNDNQLDIVVSSRDAYNFHVFLVSYYADFTNEISLLTDSSSRPYSIVADEFNQNNHLDLVVTNSGTDNVQIFLDYEKETFMNTSMYSTGFGSHPWYVITADINKDSHRDIVVANLWNNNINVFFGFGNGTFNEQTVHSTGSDSFPHSIAVGNFKNYGWMDVVVANYGKDNIGVFLGFDYPTFISYTIRLNTRILVPLHIIAADFNSDYRWDIVVSNADADTVSVLLGYGNGTFIYYRSYSTGFTPAVMAVADFNNDNKLDIAVTNTQGYSISIFLGHGNGTFAQQMLYSTGSSSPFYIAVGDYNQDKNPDFVVANRESDCIGIFLGHGNGTFSNQITYSMPNGSSPNCIAVYDFNNDGILDLAVVNRGRNEISILLGYGNGLFKNLATYSTGVGSIPYSIAIGDLNNDGSMDFAVVNQGSKNVGIFFGYGNGTFSSQTTLSTSSESILFMIVIADLNDDKILDIAVSHVDNGNGSISVLYGYGHGKFTILMTYSIEISLYPSAFVICDFNNDSRVDLAIVKPNSASIIVMLRDKSTPFPTQTTFSTGYASSPASVTIGDFNNDDHLDIAVANSGTHNIGIFLGYGNGTFSEQRTYTTGLLSAPNTIAVSDFNNDHQLDIVVSNFGTSSIGIFYGYGNGNFSVMTNYSTGIGSSPYSIAVADLDKDNRLDIVVADRGTNKIVVFYGLDNGIFGNLASYPIYYNSRPSFVSIADFNNDSWLDIAVASYGTDHVDIFLQVC
ncbi:unnamed protein product [Rotaria sp. Silwood2]|nr:unnamed protein product [Rotaria sp. Silwood2]CAF3932612.1 unnamed protein product [Rotaria sp. Silwood2]